MIKRFHKFILPIILFCLFFFSPLSTKAVKLEISLPGMTSNAASNPAEYIKTFFIFGLSLIGFVAVAALVIGGIQYMISGSIGSVEKAKKTIREALYGVVLLICSALLLMVIDPALINLAPSTIPSLRAEKYEPPSPPDNGMTAGSLKIGDAEIKCKTTEICNDIKNGKINPSLVNILGSIGTVVTETTGSHGCSAGDSCGDGAACGTSNHCSGNAVDLRTRDLTEEQTRQLLENLAANKCTDELFYANMPQYCRDNGNDASGGQSCNDPNHKNHIHYSVKPNCS